MQDYPESVISAIYEQCADNKDEIAKMLAAISNDPQKLARACRKWLEEHDRCKCCGSKLEIQRGKEYHPEVDAYEPYCEKYCPICDLGG